MCFVFYSVSEGSMSSMLSAGMIRWYMVSVCVLFQRYCIYESFTKFLLMRRIWVKYVVFIVSKYVYLACCLICKVE